MARTPADRQPHQGLLDQIGIALHTNADPARALQQQAYMKSTMPYAGITAPVLRKAVRLAIATHPIVDKAQWLASADHLWREAKVREARYAALQILGVRRYQQRWLLADCLPVLRVYVESGAWWDFVDNLAANFVGPLLDKDPARIKPELIRWSADPHLWVRRTAILSQLKLHQSTDTQLLHKAIQGSIRDPDFFARKAIGWALRAYSRSNPQWVIDYVTKHADTLSPLSRREACKLLIKSGQLSSPPSSKRGPG